MPESSKAALSSRVRSDRWAARRSSWWARNSGRSPTRGRYAISGIPRAAHRALSVGRLRQPEQQVVVETGATATVNFEVREQPIAIDEIVVTAMGLEALAKVSATPCRACARRSSSGAPKSRS
jgi:hypothetical protein